MQGKSDIFLSPCDVSLLVDITRFFTKIVPIVQERGQHQYIIGLLQCNSIAKDSAKYFCRPRSADFKFVTFILTTPKICINAGLCLVVEYHDVTRTSNSSDIGFLL